MRSFRISQRLAAMAVTMAMVLGLCAPVLAEMPPPESEESTALLNQTNLNEHTFNISRGDIWIHVNADGSQTVKVGESKDET